MSQAALDDADIADFVHRANNWLETWTEAYTDAGDDLWTVVVAGSLRA